MKLILAASLFLISNLAFSLPQAILCKHGENFLDIFFQKKAGKVYASYSYHSVDQQEARVGLPLNENEENPSSLKFNAIVKSVFDNDGNIISMDYLDYSCWRESLAETGCLSLRLLSYREGNKVLDVNLSKSVCTEVNSDFF